MGTSTVPYEYQLGCQLGTSTYLREYLHTAPCIPAASHTYSQEVQLVLVRDSTVQYSRGARPRVGLSLVSFSCCSARPSPEVASSAEVALLSRQEGTRAKVASGTGTCKYPVYPGRHHMIANGESPLAIMWCSGAPSADIGTGWPLARLALPVMVNSRHSCQIHWFMMTSPPVDGRLPLPAHVKRQVQPGIRGPSRGLVWASSEEVLLGGRYRAETGHQQEPETWHRHGSHARQSTAQVYRT